MSTKTLATWSNGVPGFELAPRVDYTRADFRIKSEFGTRSYPHTEEESATTRFMSDLVGSMKLPLSNVNSFSFERGEAKSVKDWKKLGSFNTRTHELTFTDAVVNPRMLYELPTTMMHELLHSTSPMRRDMWNRSDIFSSPKVAEMAFYQVNQLNDILYANNIVMNGYHKRLMAQCRAGEISDETLAEEVQAILGEIALRSPKQLDIIQQNIDQKAGKGAINIKTVLFYSMTARNGWSHIESIEDLERTFAEIKASSRRKVEQFMISRYGNSVIPTDLSTNPSYENEGPSTSDSLNTSTQVDDLNVPEDDGFEEIVLPTGRKIFVKRGMQPVFGVN